jgi:hypothetical protein
MVEGRVSAARAWVGRVAKHKGVSRSTSDNRQSFSHPHTPTMATFDEEKHQYAIDGQSSPTYDDQDVRKGSVTAVTEAAAMYGSVEDAESESRACQSARVASLTILQSMVTFLEA